MLIIFSAYQIKFNALHAANYGAPQACRRVLFLGARQDVLLPDFPFFPTHLFPQCESAARQIANQHLLTSSRALEM